MEHFGLTVTTVIFCFGCVVRTLVTSTKKNAKSGDKCKKNFIKYKQAHKQKMRTKKLSALYIRWNHTIGHVMQSMSCDSDEF
jgi:hypothetical protein